MYRSRSTATGWTLPKASSGQYRTVLIAGEPGAGKNFTYFTAIETFTGTVEHCGTGTMTYRIAGTVDATGKIADEWRVVPSFGTGALADVTGGCPRSC